jgi:hypothetical protein
MSPSKGSSPQVLYDKLPGDFRGFLTRNTLWLGDDHLLLVDSSRFSETYKRFYLGDIQSIVVRKAPRFVMPYYWVLLLLAALIALLVGWAPSRSVVFWTAVFLLAAVALYLYVASMFQSCTCHLITRVNRVELTSLFRLRSAQEFVAILAPRIIAAQGELPPDWVERSTTIEELSSTADRNPDSPVVSLPTIEFSFLNVVVFLFVLVDAGLTWMQLRSPETTSLTLPNVVNMIALAVCATFVIVRLSRSKGGRALKMSVLAGLFVVAGGTYGGVLLQSFDHQFLRETATTPLLYHGMRQLAIGEIVADIGVAIPGLVFAFRQRGGVTP